MYILYIYIYMRIFFFQDPFPPPLVTLSKKTGSSTHRQSAPDLQRLNDLARHRPDIGPPVPADLRDVMQAAHGEAEELPGHGQGGTMAAQAGAGNWKTS